MVDQVKELYVFQRTPNWFFPRIEGKIPNWAKKFLATFPIVNNFIYWFIFVFARQEYASLPSKHFKGLISHFKNTLFDFFHRNQRPSAFSSRNRSSS